MPIFYNVGPISHYFFRKPTVTVSARYIKARNKNNVLNKVRNTEKPVPLTN